MKKKKFTNCNLFYCYHFFLVIACIIVCTLTPRKVSTSFMDAVPAVDIPQGFIKAQNKFTSSQNNSVALFVECSSFDKAKQAALSTCSMLSYTGLFKKVSCENTFNIDSSLLDFINSNYIYLLDKDTIKSITNNPEDFAQNSLARIYSGFSLSNLDNIESDPFLLADCVLLSYMEKASVLSPFSPKDGVLTTFIDNNWYIIVNAVLTDKALSVLNNNTSKDIFSVVDYIEQQYPDCRIYTSGFPLHANESAVKSRNEITLITVFSLLAMSLIFFIAFRNFNIVRLFLLSISLSVISAISAVLIVFPRIHIITLIFGTTLIGTCVDYSIHFYVRYAIRDITDSALDVRKKLSKSLTVGFVSTAICYAALMLSGYSILRQVAVFSCAGLFSSYLTAMFLYPVIIKDSMISKNSVLKNTRKKLSIPYLLPYMAIISTIMFFFLVGKIKISNNVSSLYTPGERLLEGETKAANISGYKSTIYAIASGETEMQAIENASNFSQKARDMGFTVISTDMFIPTLSAQKQSFEAVRLLETQINDQCNILGISDKNFRLKIENPEPFTELPDSLKTVLSSISLGKIDNLWYEAVIIRDCNNNKALKAITGPDIVLFDTAEDISVMLDKLTKLILILFTVSSLIMFVSVMFIYGFKRGIRIAMSPYTIVLSTLSFAPIIGIQIDFFYAVGMILVIGLGLDYIVFASDETGGGSIIAVALSFITTELSFGTLMFSSFKPVHVFGIVVFIGIFVAFLCSLFSHGDKYI